MHIAENLRRMRRECDLTQEELANFIGVSFQAISKWERGDGYPDITFLPALANFFETTVDTLLGMDKMHCKDEIEKVLAANDAMFPDGRVEERINMLRGALQRYPGSYELWSVLAHALTFSYADEEAKEHNTKEAIEICERILLRCMDNAIRNKAQSALCYLYYESGQRERALESAKQLPYIWDSALIRADFMEGGERLEEIRYNIAHLTFAIDWQIRRLHDHEEALSTEERIAIYNKGIALFELVYEGREYWHAAVNMAERCRWLAELYLEQDDTEMALDMLEKAVPYSIMYDNQPEEAVHTSALLSGLPFKRTDYGKDYPESFCYRMLEHLGESKYDLVRNDPRFAAIVEDLSKHAE
ncbi:MAG: helix-turn-helix domain-containing protein [Oscillospiraceae bacterium]|nr:helix-turn-helix domain-containing protein [Oscillospiraceae bacterium]